MIARIQRWLVLGVLIVAGAAALWAWRAGHPAWAAAIVAVALLGHASVLGLEFLLMHAVNRRDPAPRAGAGRLIVAWLHESWHAPLVFCWRQPFRSRRFPDRTAPADRCGVLLVHGFVCNRGLWNRWLRRLARDGVPFVAVNLEPPFGRIDDYLERIERAVALLESDTGRPPVAVAHSMGGLALRRWWSEPGNGERIAHALTLGSPHHGTWLARLAVSPNARQMRQHNAWLRTLAAGETQVMRARLTCFYSNTDNIVFPASTATLEGADNRLLEGLPHVAMVDDPRPWEALQHWLRH